MRFFALVLVFVALSGNALAGELDLELIDRLSKHVDKVRYDPIVRQAAGRNDKIAIHVRFNISRDGKLYNIRTGGAKISPELRKYLIRAFDRLPPVRNIPDLKGKSFDVVLGLGGRRG